MSEVLDGIISWASSELNFWEKAALEIVLSGRPIEEADYEKIVEYFFQDAGLAEVPKDRPAIRFEARRIGEARVANCHIERIYNLTNVNALPANQEVRFGPRLSVVYGENGAGKTGYVRPLGCAAFARGQRQVLPNANSTELPMVPQADIDVSWNGRIESIHWTYGKEDGELSQFHVLDGAAFTAHLNQANSLSYSPGGLWVLTELANITDKVRTRVRAQMAQWSERPKFEGFFEGISEVTKKLPNLEKPGGLAELESLAVLSDAESKKIGQLDMSIARLKAMDVPKQITLKTKEVMALKTLRDAVDHAQTALGEDVAESTRSEIEVVRACRKDVSTSGADQFKFDRFTQIGTAAWIRFLQSAKALADAESREGNPYPTISDLCLLCRQPLSSNSVELISAFWSFLKSDAQERLKIAQSVCDKRKTSLGLVALGYFDASSGVRASIESDLPHLVGALDMHVQACVQRREDLVTSILEMEPRIPAPLIKLDLVELDRVIKVREADIRALTESDAAKQLAEELKEMHALTQRQVLSKHIQSMRDYVEKLKLADSAQRSLGSTRLITTKYNELFEALVTDKFRRRFAETVGKFRKDMKVAVETHGVKGETVRQLVLSTAGQAKGYSVDQVLSDGEKRAVVIADFLTEATLDADNRGIILDDPITSLDNTWKETLAVCLVEEAKSRQVIIFTHDLAFLYALKEAAESLNVDTVTHWIRSEEGQPGYVYLNNSPGCERSFKSAERARAALNEAKALPPEKQEAKLQEGYGALRTSYEALILFEIFGDTVGRFDERIRVENLKKVYTDSEVTDEVIKRFGDISRHIIAHSHSDRFAASRPVVDDLRDEIDAFERLRATVKERKKIAAAPAAKAELRGASGSTGEHSS